MSLALLLGAGMTGMKNAQIFLVEAFFVVFISLARYAVISLARYARAAVALSMSRNLKEYAGYSLNLSSLKKTKEDVQTNPKVGSLSCTL